MLFHHLAPKSPWRRVVRSQNNPRRGRRCTCCGPGLPAAVAVPPSRVDRRAYRLAREMALRTLSQPPVRHHHPDHPPGSCGAALWRARPLARPGDARGLLELLPQLPEASIDCLLTDPPYGISLMSGTCCTPTPTRRCSGSRRRSAAKAVSPPRQTDKRLVRRRPRHPARVPGVHAALRRRCLPGPQARRERVFYSGAADGASSDRGDGRRRGSCCGTCWRGTNRRRITGQKRLQVCWERRACAEAAQLSRSFRSGNLAPRWGPIAWFFKPYRLTITDNILEHGGGQRRSTALRCWRWGREADDKTLSAAAFRPSTAMVRSEVHEAQSRCRHLLELLIQLVTNRGRWCSIRLLVAARPGGVRACGRGGALSLGETGRLCHPLPPAASPQRKRSQRLENPARCRPARRTAGRGKRTACLIRRAACNHGSPA